MTTFGEMTFDKLIFGEMTFGEVAFGDLTFGELTGHRAGRAETTPARQLRHTDERTQVTV